MVKYVTEINKELQKSHPCQLAGATEHENIALVVVVVVVVLGWRIRIR